MEQHEIFLTAFDQTVNNGQSQFLKAAIPYLPPRGQQLLSVYAKTMELFNTLSLFSSGQKGMQMCTAAPKSDPLEMIQDIRKFCYGESRQMLDKASEMIAMTEVLHMMQEIPKGEEESDESGLEE